MWAQGHGFLLETIVELTLPELQRLIHSMPRIGLSVLFMMWAAVIVPAHAECTCLFKGGTAKEGETVCIWTAKGNALARCEKVQNNTSWKLLDQPCEVQQSLRLPNNSTPAEKNL